MLGQRVPVGPFEVRETRRDDLPLLAERRALYIAGSDVRNLSANAVNGGVVEFADIAVVR